MNILKDITINQIIKLLAGISLAGWSSVIVISYLRDWLLVWVSIPLWVVVIWCLLFASVLLFTSKEKEMRGE